MKFKFELSEKEVAHIVRNFLEEQGHVPEGGNADLVVVPGAKKADPYAFEATVDVPLDITTNLGGGTLTALGHKPKEDLSAFQPEPEQKAEPKKKRKRRTKAEIEADKAKEETPKAVEDGIIKKEWLQNSLDLAKLAGTKEQLPPVENIYTDQFVPIKLDK